MNALKHFLPAALITAISITVSASGEPEATPTPADKLSIEAKEPASAPPASAAPAEASRKQERVSRMGLSVRPAIFNDNYADGVDPFFPSSRRRYPKSVPQFVAAPEASVDEPGGHVDHLSLKGITGVGTARLALINNRTFSSGETALVRTPTGQMKIRVLEVGDSSVKLTIGNEGKIHEIRLETMSYDFTQAR